MTRGLVLMVLVASATAAHAESAIVTGTVVKVEHQEIYVSVGEAQGVASGAPIRIKHPVRLKHPITRAVIDDWVPVGSATVTQAGGQLSRAVIGELVATMRVGDIAEVLIQLPDAPAPQPTKAAPAPAPPVRQVDPETAAVLQTFAEQSGATLDARIAGWESYLSKHASSPYGDAVRKDLEQLRVLRDQLAPSRGGPARAEVAAVDHDAPHSADAQQPLALVFVLTRPGEVASAYLNYRTTGKRAFERVLLAREHDIYLRGAVPAAAVAAPGVDYFLEVSARDGSAGLAVGSPAQPVHVAVARPSVGDRFAVREQRTTLALGGEYVDFATFDSRTGEHRDLAYRGHLDVSYRLDTAVQRIGVGYGTVIGREATVPARTGFHYGQAAVDLGTRELIVGGSAIAGVGKDGFGVGVEGRARVGAADGTNLAVRGQQLPEIGWLADARFGAQPADKLLLGLSVGATDQPARGDVAATLGLELEWIGLLQPSSLLVRVSWQGRSIDHGGIGGGAGVGFTW